MCDEIGAGYETVDTCGADQLCSRGVCNDIVCEAGTSRCSGDVLFECSVDGLVESETSCLEASAYCDGASCVDWACTPDSVECAADEVAECDSRGTGFTIAETCSEALGCSDGACVEGCGDGIVQATEECDDGNLDDGDGCNAACETEFEPGSVGTRCWSDDNCVAPLVCSERPNGAPRSCAPDGWQYIPPGTYERGNLGEVPHSGVSPASTVILTRGFVVSEFEVTHDEFVSLMGFTHTSFPACGDECPEDTVTFYEALRYANALSERDGLAPCYTGSGSSWAWSGLDCEGYRLATEAEWETAARCGVGSEGVRHVGENYCSDDESCEDDIAWHTANSGATPHPVGMKLPNDCNLYDTLGNVSEWVWDWYNASYWEPLMTDPIGPPSGSIHPLKGGNFRSGSVPFFFGRNRFDGVPGIRYNFIGFRLVRTVPPSTVCGDSVLDLGEECDDGNLDDGDGCDSTCFEELPVCPDEDMTYDSEAGLCTTEWVPGLTRNSVTSCSAHFLIPLPEPMNEIRAVSRGQVSGGWVRLYDSAAGDIYENRVLTLHEDGTCAAVLIDIAPRYGGLPWEVGSVRSTVDDCESSLAPGPPATHLMGCGFYSFDFEGRRVALPGIP
ncbi:MAG: cysteine-rich repeat protein [Bradymonadia bacterium]